MAYTKTEIINYGLRTEFAEALKNFFINNEVVKFNLVSEDMTATLPTFTLERNNLNIVVTIGASTSSPQTTKFVVSSKGFDDTYTTHFNSTIAHASSDSSSTDTSRKLQLLLAESNGAILLQVSAWNADAVSKGMIILDVPLSNGENMIGTGSWASTATILTFKEVATQQTYTIRPFHTGSNDEAKLILSNQLAVNNSNGVYLAEALGLQSAGGAKQFSFYTTELNSYYGLLTDVCIPMGDKREYVVDETTE